MHFYCIWGCLGAKYCIFVVLGAVWEPKFSFSYIRGCLRAKLCIFAVLGPVWEPNFAFLLY